MKTSTLLILGLIAVGGYVLYNKAQSAAAGAGTGSSGSGNLFNDLENGDYGNLLNDVGSDLGLGSNSNGSANPTGATGSGDSQDDTDMLPDQAGGYISGDVSDAGGGIGTTGGVYTDENTGA